MFVQFVYANRAGTIVGLHACRAYKNAIRFNSSSQFETQCEFCMPVRGAKLALDGRANSPQVNLHGHQLASWELLSFQNDYG
jgi:hypothetical protein